MTTTARGLPAGCHSRVKILMPSTALKLPSVMVESPPPDGVSIATLHRPSQGGPTMEQWLHRTSHTLARFCLAGDAQPGQCGDSLARALPSEYPRKVVEADDPSSTLTILRRRPAEPTPFGRAPPTHQRLRGEVGWRVPCLLSQREQAIKIVVIGGSGLC